MKEFFSKKESVTALKSEQWAEFKKKQLRDTNLALDRIIDPMKSDDLTAYTPEDIERMAANQKRVEKDMDEFKKNKELWSDKLRKKEKELGFSSDEWWSPYFNFYVPRDIVDPLRRAKSDRNVWKRIGLWIYKNCFNPKQVVVSLDVREYPEFVDERIRDLVVRLNNLPFIKTRGSCSGHGENDRSSANTVEGYDAANLHFVINRNLPRGEEFLQAPRRLVQEFNEPLSAVSIRENFDNRNDDKLVEMYSMEFYRRAPSHEWLEKHHKPHLTYTKIPEKQEEFEELFHRALEKNGVPATDHAVERLAYDYFEHLEKEYGDYSTSEGAKKRTEEFWRRIGELVDRFSVEHKS